MAWLFRAGIHSDVIAQHHRKEPMNNPSPMNSLMHTVGGVIHRTNWRRFAWVAATIALVLLAMIIIPSIGSLSPAAIEARNGRNAQSVVALYRSGAETGVNWTGKTRMARIEAVCNGQTPADGAFSGKLFRMPLDPGEERTGAAKYIGMDANGDLFYDPSGGQSAL